MMKRVFVAAALTFAAFQPAAAQSWVPWHQPSIYDRSGYSAPQRSEERKTVPVRSPASCGAVGLVQNC